MIKKLSLVALFCALQACNLGEDDSKDEPKNELSNFVSGKVIDGYVSGATVWLDINGDGIQGDSEPSTLSGDAGNYSLELTPSESECLPYSTVYVDVPVGAMDEDLGEVTEAYQMSFPPQLKVLTDEELINISPLTTVVWDQLRDAFLVNENQILSCDDLKNSFNLRNKVSETIADVMLSLVRHYNLSEQQIYSDFVASADSAAYNAAQNIVKGLKVAFAHKLELQDMNPDANWVNVNVYKDGDLDSEQGFEDAWYRSTLIYLNDGYSSEIVKLTDEVEKNEVDVELTILNRKDKSWGDSSFNASYKLRNDKYRRSNGSQECVAIERVTLEPAEITYDLSNSFNVACDETQLDSPYERGLTVSYSNSGVYFTSEFYFRDGQDGYSNLSDWINFVDRSDLNPQDIIDHIESLPYRWESDVNLQVDQDISLWRKYRQDESGRVILTNGNSWERTSYQSDNTVVIECSENGQDWTACDS